MFANTIVFLIIAVLFVGFLVWIMQYLPVAEPFKQIAVGLAIFGIVIYVLSVLTGHGGATIPRFL